MPSARRARCHLPSGRMLTMKAPCARTCACTPAHAHHMGTPLCHVRAGRSQENVPNGRYHALTSQALYEAAEDACGGDYARCFWPRDDVPCPKKCDDAVSAATTHAMDGTIDIYDIYEDVCLAGQTRLQTQTFTLLHERHTARHKRAAAAAAARPSPHGRQTQTTISPIFPTCAHGHPTTAVRALPRSPTISPIFPMISYDLAHLPHLRACTRALARAPACVLRHSRVCVCGGASALVHRPLQASPCVATRRLVCLVARRRPCRVPSARAVPRAACHR